MRTMISFFFLVAVITLSGCGKPDATAPADHASQVDQTAQEPISDENFESGEAKGAMQTDGGEQETDGTGEGDTP